MDDLIAQVTKLGLTLPDYFVRFMSSAWAQRATLNVFFAPLTESILYQTRGGRGVYDWEFLKTRNDTCFFWYLHLDKQSRDCVLHSCTRIEVLWPEVDPVKNADNVRKLKNRLNLINLMPCRCSYSFENFIKRYYLGGKFLDLYA